MTIDEIKNSQSNIKLAIININITNAANCVMFDSERVYTIERSCAFRQPIAFIF